MNEQHNEAKLGYCPSCLRWLASVNDAQSMSTGDVYVEVATEHREAIELARRVTSSEIGDSGGFSWYFASALVAIDDAMRSALTSDA